MLLNMLAGGEATYTFQSITRNATCCKTYKKYVPHGQLDLPKVKDASTYTCLLSIAGALWSDFSYRAVRQATAPGMQVHDRGAATTGERKGKRERGNVCGQRIEADLGHYLQAAQTGWLLLPGTVPYFRVRLPIRHS